MKYLSDPRYGEDWEGAVCAQIGSEVADGIFFSTTPGRIAQAVTLCWDCPLRALCATSALEEEKYTPAAERFGIRGGLTPEQRAKLQPHRICPDCGSPVITKSRHCDTDREDHRKAHRRAYERQERRAA